MKIGFIGIGNMASAMIKGYLAADFCSPRSIYAFDVQEEACGRAKKAYDVNICQSAAEVVRESNYVVLAVKPNVLASVLEDIRAEVGKKHVVLVSIVAGKTIAFIEKHVGPHTPVIRVLPNINAQVGASMTAYCGNMECSPVDREVFGRTLQGIGEAIELEEKYFDLVFALAGSGPAFAYIFIDALAQAALKKGMSKEAATKIAAQMTFGSAKMVLESGVHPRVLVDQVCSPGGMTIEGVGVLQEKGFEHALVAALVAAAEKAEALKANG